MDGSDTPRADAPGEPAIVRFGPFRFDRHGLLLSNNGQTVEIAPRALRVLRCLVRRPGQVVRKNELLDRVWEDVAITDRSLVEAVWILRKALGDDPRQPTYIETVHRRGYRFIGSVAADARARRDPGESVSMAPRVRRAVRPRRRLVWALAGVAAGAAAVLLVLRPAASPNDGPTGRFSIALAEGHRLANGYKREVAVSPDGRTLVFLGCCPGRLWLRHLDEQRVDALEGTAGAEAPFFSPDGRWIAFWGHGQRDGAALKKIEPRSAANPVTLATHADFRARDSEFTGGTWLDDETLLVSIDSVDGGLWRVPASGGSPVLAVANPSSDLSYRHPERLPVRGAVLVTLFSPARQHIAVVDLDGGGHRILVEDAAAPLYLQSGHLLFVQDGTLFAVRFDPSRLDVVGGPIALDDTVRIVEGGSQAAASMNGVLVLAPAAGGPIRELQLIDRAGEMQRVATPTDEPPDQRTLLDQPRFCCSSAGISPDGTRIVISTPDLWSVDPRGEAPPIRLTSGEWNRQPVWRPDGEAFAFAQRSSGVYELRLVDLARGRGHSPLLRRPNHLHPESWSPDGRYLVYTENVVAPGDDEGVDRRHAGEDLWALPVSDVAHPIPLLRTRFHESGASISPDGRWFVYHSDETGSWEVYARPFPKDPDVHDPSGKGSVWRVSENCGGWPVWSPEGDEIFFLTCRPPQTLWAVEVRRDPIMDGLAFSEPRPLFEGRFHVWRPGPSYSIGPDGRFVMIAHEPRRIDRLHVIVDFHAELERLLPAR